MENKQVLYYEYEREQTAVHPAHKFVKPFCFTMDETDEACLAHYMAVVAEKNGMSANDMSHVFPYVLRMLKSNIDWSR